MDPQPHPADIWQQALSQLQCRMDRRTFDWLLRGSELLDAGDTTWTIAVPHPGAIDWLANRLQDLVGSTLTRFTGRAVALGYVPSSVPPGPEPEDAAGPHPNPDPGPDPDPDPSPPDLDPFLSFDPNAASGGGFWMMGNYATHFWAALLGPVAWRVYELVVSGDKRSAKTLWSPPRRYSISELARAIASGRGGAPNRDQIRGRFRHAAGERHWRPGAFDRLVEAGVAHVAWHDGSRIWQPWTPGGSERPGRSGLRIVYRLSVVTFLPLLTPFQVAHLPAELQVAHDRYLADRGLDPVAWEQIARRTLAGLDR